MSGVCRARDGACCAALAEAWAVRSILLGVMSQSTAGTEAAARTIDIGQIMRLLPHRYPFLLIDRVVEVEPRQRIVAIKNVSMNEPYFQGHFPDYPLMPGVLIVEAIAQAGGVLLLDEIPDREGKLMVFTGIDGAKFRRPVTPGDQLRIEVKVLQWRSRAVKMQGTVTVDGKIACEATVMCQLVPKPAAGTAPATLPAQTESIPAAMGVEKPVASGAQTVGESNPEQEPTALPEAAV